MYRGLMLSLALVCCDVQGTYAQSNNKIQDAIRVIVMLCVAGGERVEVSGTATGDGGRSLASYCNPTGAAALCADLLEGLRRALARRRENPPHRKLAFNEHNYEPVNGQSFDEYQT